jgi:uncharacterized protein YbjQ (UPF0145 family)
LRDRINVVSTTPALEGWEIQSYLGPVSAQVVAGTGLFSDWAASLTDVFGGRSGAYQKQLGTINEEAIRQLRDRATLLGANCIVGLRIDHDEISGKGKAMLMVTAVGTAVRARRIVPEQTAGESGERVVDSDLVETLMRKQKIIRAASEGRLRLNEDTWRFAIENRVHEIASYVLDEVGTLMGHEYRTPSESDFVDMSKRYLLSLPEDIVKEVLYEALVSKEDMRGFVVEVIQEGSLMDLKRISSLLESDEHDIRRSALRLLRFNKSYYVSSDLLDFSSVRTKVESMLVSENKDTIVERAWLSGKSEHKWVCTCGAKVSEDRDVCKRCNRDRTGFDPHDEAHPQRIVDLLERKIEILKNLFDSSDDEPGRLDQEGS